MGAMQNPDYRRAPFADLDQYGEKTSEHGHYELASQYKSGKSHFRWVEDNRKFEAPPQQEQAPAPASETPTVEAKLSDTAASAIAYTDAYENKILPNNGSITVGGNIDAVQNFKDAYQSKLTKALKANDPVTLAKKQAEIELKDKYSLDLAGGGLFS